KKLHLHLLKLTHTEDKLAGYDFISESLANLRNSKRNLHPCSFLHIQEIDKNPLSCLRSKINSRRILRNRADLGGKHQIELAYFCPIGRATDRAFDAFIYDEISHSGKIF